MLRILVIHGYVQTAQIVANNTVALKERLADIAQLTYIDGPIMEGWGDSRPWWVLDMSGLKYKADGRWDTSVKWLADHLSQNQYDGIIGLSQGAALTALLLSMISHPERVPGRAFDKILEQPIKFAIMSSGFTTRESPQKDLYDVPDHIATLHTLDDNDRIVPANRSVELSELCKNRVVLKHNEGHRIPVQGDWPTTIRNFIVSATSS